jgi:hypothetical protein|tara:strand:+ start:1769 stop:2083 length:315 start_codon:yes stop_codon:yes gene_type:complete
MKKSTEVWLDNIEELAPKYAEAKANSFQVQEFKKTQRSILYGRAFGKTVADKEHWVNIQPEMEQANKAIAIAIEAEEELRWRLKQNELRIEVWRTEQANQRMVG